MNAVSTQVVRKARGLHGILVEVLGQQIVDGTIGSDKPLVPESLCDDFQVSRTVVRETLRVLETKGLIFARPNVGTRIEPVERWNLLDPDVLRWLRGNPRADHLHAQMATLTVALRELGGELAGNLFYETLMASLAGKQQPAESETQEPDETGPVEPALEPETGDNDQAHEPEPDTAYEYCDGQISRDVADLTAARPPYAEAAA